MREFAHQAAAFLGVGLASYLVYVAVFEALPSLLPEIVRLSAGYAASVATHFFLNKTLTFGRRSMTTGMVLRYAIVVFANYVTSIAAATGLLSLSVMPAFAILAGTATTTVQGFLLCRYGVFADVNPATRWRATRP